MGESCPAVCAVRFLYGRKGKFILYCFVPIIGGGPHRMEIMPAAASLREPADAVHLSAEQRRISPAFGDERLLISGN